ncbi:MAG TPA: aminoacyl--tRNA ligase-related protein, partial [Alphaproteobacteria bacterium]|nr:aminoacyl--tRNA ligase-related protein [Alphaproteobacteria bacterium]
RDLPMLTNQWANVVRWEMRTRLFLRTAEFLWQEGHTAHADADEAREETMRMLEEYRTFAEETLAMPVIAGEKPENERFPGAVSTYSIEAMMQDGKALQAGTSHYLGTHFAEAQNIRFQNEAGELALCHTTSWGVSTRLIGGVIMTHGDDDGLRVPPAIAPRQVVIVPILRDKPEDADVLAYCDALVTELNGSQALGTSVRAIVDMKPLRSADKRWNWVRRGAPVIAEIGPRDVTNGQVTYMRRDALKDGPKLKSTGIPRADFIASIGTLLSEIQDALYREAKERLEANIIGGYTNFEQIAEYFGPSSESEEDEAGAAFKGWVRVPWSRPTGADLDAVGERLRALKLTIRNAPLDQPASFGACVFTGKPGIEEILIGRAY